MGREPRAEGAGLSYHLTSKGNEGSMVFATPAARDAFVRILRRVCQRYGWVCHAYCVLGNHVHIVITTPEPNLSAGMRDLLGHYARWYRSHHPRRGHVFDGRYRSRVIDSADYLTSAIQYVVSNPVAAGLVADPSDWRWAWSSWS